MEPVRWLTGTLKSMLTLLNHFFITFIYQPFFNLLVYIYLVLDKITGGQADMGVALIIFTFIFRIILLPLSLNADRSEKEKREIKTRVEDIEKTYRHDPIKCKAEIKKVVSYVIGLIIFFPFLGSLQ